MSSCPVQMLSGLNSVEKILILIWMNSNNKTLAAFTPLGSYLFWQNNLYFKVFVNLLGLKRVLTIHFCQWRLAHPGINLLLPVNLMKPSTLFQNGVNLVVLCFSHSVLVAFLTVLMLKKTSWRKQCVWGGGSGGSHASSPQPVWARLVGLKTNTIVPAAGSQWEATASARWTVFCFSSTFPRWLLPGAPPLPPSHQEDIRQNGKSTRQLWPCRGASLSPCSVSCPRGLG